MPYTTEHFGIQIEYTSRADGPNYKVGLNITPSFTPVGCTASSVGEVFVNGQYMNAFDKQDKGDLEALERLRETLGLETTMPHTIYTFADIRLRRYESELTKCRQALELTKALLNEPSIDIWAATEQRRQDAKAAIDEALKEKTLQDLINQTNNAVQKSESPV
jgi:hypothetical protein